MWQANRDDEYLTCEDCYSQINKRIKKEAGTKWSIFDILKDILSALELEGVSMRQEEANFNEKYDKMESVIDAFDLFLKSKRLTL